MLNERLIVQTTPKADKKNMVFWRDYRVTVLTERLFRLEKSPNGKFRDEATQAIWYRNTVPQNFKLLSDEAHAVIETEACRLILYKDRGQVCVEFGEYRRSLNNHDNLLGTYRTLDCCDGDVHFVPWLDGNEPKKIALSKGVCSKTGVAVLDDSNSYTLGADGAVKREKANGSDEYVFVYGDDYRTAVRALYMITGRTPLVPRFALGNWWSRYHAYTESEYLRTLNRFEDRGVPFSVATVDMDWHYSAHIDEELGVTENGMNHPEYVGKPEVNLGWTGYTWNKNLFPEPQRFLDDLHARGMKVTLNLHPSDGFRYWEECYENMANAMGMDATKGECVPFDFSYDRFINAYFDLAHTPLEKMGVDFWWIDWQQKEIDWHDYRPEPIQKLDPIPEKYDPLWALNHYHFYDNAAKTSRPLVLSRYAGVGSHRYPLGFSGDTEITWRTLAYLPYFTATATNIGYTWWSHDIGGHNLGEKNDELFVRHLQYGVFSPITRLHCTADETMTKEPWAYTGGSGLIIEEFLRFRHKLVPYLYTADYYNCVEGTALVEPMYYEWKNKGAYAYKEEYRFGSELVVIPVTQRGYHDGFARVRAWLPEGKWTDIFTGDEYEVSEGGEERVLLRDLASIPVLAKRGAILPLSADGGNSVNNPEKLEVWAFEGEGVYSMYEDGLERDEKKVLMTDFASAFREEEGVCMQVLQITTRGEGSVAPKNRTVKVSFRNVTDGRVKLFVDGEEKKTKMRLAEFVEITFPFEAGKTYRVEVIYPAKTKMEKIIERAKKVLTVAQAGNYAKELAWKAIKASTTEEEYSDAVNKATLELCTKLRLKETT